MKIYCLIRARKFICLFFIIVGEIYVGMLSQYKQEGKKIQGKELSDFLKI